ncbi:MAG: RidA family protein [Bifidobacteriaceae bacterium]|jgi:enamine deaminase RidA (YjgF/YER057c/UK114 family)|nr:RidA family protein [Bifidobacteriaceae bacterium]
MADHPGAAQDQAESPQQRLAALGIELPKPASPLASYIPVRLTGRRAWVSGQGPVQDGISLYQGRLGDSVSLEEGAAAARLATINLLAALQAALGGLDRVSHFERLSVMVAATPDFTRHPAVANGASELLLAVFGEAGRHSRVAFGVASLPLGWPVELEAQVFLTRH